MIFFFFFFITCGVGANETTSSAYAKAPTKMLPIKHPILVLASLHNKPSK